MPDNFDDLIRFRCHSTLTARIARIAERLRREEPDLYRIIFEDFAREQEDKLALPPLAEDPNAVKFLAKPQPGASYFKTKKARARAANRRGFHAPDASPSPKKPGS